MPVYVCMYIYIYIDINILCVGTPQTVFSCRSSDGVAKGYARSRALAAAATDHLLL